MHVPFFPPPSPSSTGAPVARAGAWTSR